MQANELMTGDWVLIKRTPSCEYPYKICSINNYSILGEDYADWIEVEAGEEINLEDIKPIPLTAEILEKNGWKKEFDKKPYMTFYHLEDEKYWLMWCISEHTLDIQRQNKTLLDQYNLCAERVVIACNYVHQLQHALRLCGIDKEIVL